MTKIASRLFPLAAAFGIGLAAAQPYPSHPVKVIVPWPPGQATDSATRVVAEKMSAALFKMCRCVARRLKPDA